MIVDGHVHVFPEITGLAAQREENIETVCDQYGRLVGIRHVKMTQPWSRDRPLMDFRHTPEMLIANMDFARVDRAVLLQGPAYGECNDYVADAVRNYPDRLIGAAYIDPWEPGFRGKFERIARSSFCAAKIELTDNWGLNALHPGVVLDDPQVSWLYGELERREFVLVLDLGSVGSRSYQTRAVRGIAEEHPNLKVVICHLAQPTPDAEADHRLWRMWEDQIGLGKLRNVWFDTAAVCAYVRDEGFPFPTAGRYFKMAVERIGPQKIIWGTDMPMTLDFMTYPELVEIAYLHSRFLPPAEQAMVLGENAKRVYDLRRAAERGI
ncbi:MAG: amidohydrolase family protein [Candidatus Bathyarchaeia archaeon]